MADSPSPRVTEPRPREVADGDAHRQWWERGVIYQVYPRSFQDSDGDGVGDLRGLRDRLDYLQWLGVDIVWLSPIYPSPMADFGYDISDYCNVHPLFGTLNDFDGLVHEAHARGMKVLLDFVPNHTSDQHPWFEEARSSRDNPKRDWYIWRDPAPGGGPPNNWLSNFGGSAWEFEARTGQYYYHAFLKEQPDLHWRNPAVQAAMFDVLRFWLNRGVDGFRVDVIWHIVKDDQFRDNPRNPAFGPHQAPHHELLALYSTDRPEVHEIISKMRAVLDEYPQRMMVGEIYLPVERLVTYYGATGRGVHLPFNFQLIDLPWDARTIASAVEAYEAALPSYGWPNWVLGNHDKPRLASRIGAAQTRVAALLLLTLRGTPTLYYGDEIGMNNQAIPRERIQDPFELNVPGRGLGRDPSRTPMQWNGAAHAGFSSAEPWLPVGADFSERNVDAQRADPRSLLNLYRELLSLRRVEPALAVGAISLVSTHGQLLAYVRERGDDRFLVVLNFRDAPAGFATTALNAAGEIVLDTHHTRQGQLVSGDLRLGPNEGVIIRLHAGPTTLTPHRSLS